MYLPRTSTSTVSGTELKKFPKKKSDIALVPTEVGLCNCQPLEDLTCTRSWKSLMAALGEGLQTHLSPTELRKQYITT